MSNERMMKIKDLPIDAKGKLTKEVRDKLGYILVEEFNNRTTKLQQEKDETRAKALEQYKKENGYAALKAKYSRAVEATNLAEKKQKEAREELALKLGLTVDGFKLNDVNYHFPGGTEKAARAKAAVEKLNKVLDAADAPSQAMTTMRNKLMARLQLATTIGEAVVILSEVMGNEILPSLPWATGQALIEAPKS